MRLRFWNSSQSSTLVMMEGCLDSPKTSAPRRKTRVATYWFAPLIRLTTAITAATPMTTPMSVRTLRSLCAQRLEAEMATASDKFIVVGRGIEPRDTTAPHPSIRAGEPWDYRLGQGTKENASKSAAGETRFIGEPPQRRMVGEERDGAMETSK